MILSTDSYSIFQKNEMCKWIWHLMDDTLCKFASGCDVDIFQGNGFGVIGQN